MIKHIYTYIYIRLLLFLGVIPYIYKTDWFIRLSKKQKIQTQPKKPLNVV